MHIFVTRYPPKQQNMRVLSKVFLSLAENPQHSPIFSQVCLNQRVPIWVTATVRVLLLVVFMTPQGALRWGTAQHAL